MPKIDYYSESIIETILAHEIDIIYKKKQEIYQPFIKMSSDIFEYLKIISQKCLLEIKEYFWILFLNRGNTIIGWHKISEGSMVFTVVDERLLVNIALRCGALGIIIAHNHPSNNIKPSEQDIVITKKIEVCLDLFKISLLDSIVFSRNSYFSFADEGIL